MAAEFEFDWCDIAVSEDTMSGGVAITFTNKSDGEGNQLPKEERQMYHAEMDNYQAYRLAMEILKRVDVNDTRGSH